MDQRPPDPNATGPGGVGMGPLHMDHCMEQLRQAILCHADATRVTLKPVQFIGSRQWLLVGETERAYVSQQRRTASLSPCQVRSAMVMWISLFQNGEGVEVSGGDHDVSHQAVADLVCFTTD